MPPLETSFYNQAAQVWTATITPDNYGQPRVTARREIRVRWEDRKLETSDPQGNTIMVDAVVTTSEDIPVGSWLWLGEEKDWPSNNTLNPLTQAPLHSVTFLRRIPDVKSRGFERQLGVMRAGHTLPTIV